MYSQIERFSFVDWRGPPPVLSQEQGVTFHRPGSDGVGQQTTGIWEDPFTVTLVHWASTFAIALRNYALMDAILVRTGPQRLIFESIDYARPPFRHLYMVDHIMMTSCQQQVRQLYSPAPAINRLGGAEALIEFTLTPYFLG